MANDSSNSTVEMGTSDQALVAAKRKKRLIYIVGGVVMVINVIVVIAFVVILSGNEGSATTEDPINTTEGPTTPIGPSTTASTTTPAPVTTPPTEPPPSTTTEPPPQEDSVINLEDIINGAFASPSFNGAWTGDNDILFRNADGDLVLYDLDTDSTTSLVANTSQILQQSGRFTALSPDQSHVALAYQVEPVYRHSFVARYAAINLVTGEEILIGGAAENSTRSTPGFLQNFIWGPSGTSLAYVFGNNIFYQDTLNAEPVQITTSGVEDVIYNGIPDWVYEEEVFSSNNAMWFSTDGSMLAFATFDDTDVRIMKVPQYGVPGSLDWQYTKHHEIRYPKPGTNNPTVSVTIRNLQNVGSTQQTVYNAPSDLVEPILKVVRFVSNETIALMWSNRVQNSISVELCTLGNAVCTQIYQYTETDGWVDNIPLFFNTDGNSFITILPQAVDGVLYKQIVQVSETNNSGLWTSQNRINTAHTVLDIFLWTSNDVIWYKATHVNDSAEQHIYSAGADVTCFTCGIQREDGGRCLYNEATFSGDGARLALNCAGPDVPKVYIYNNNATYVRTWDDNSETAEYVASKAVPETIRLQVPVAAGLPDADVHIQVPADYLQRTNVPLLVYVYGGPDSSLVTKQWGIDWGTSLVTRWNVAVAHIDGRGSGLRGVANTFTLNRALGTVEVEDQINVTRYLQENLSWVDANRTCIWGWSYGGYAASLALARGGAVFRCAAAVAPVVDWKYYDTIYTERYMDLPQNNSQAYTDSSLLTLEVAEAYRDKRYFLVHGTADDNVHYQHAMLFSRLLQRQDVYFTQMSYTDEDHGLVGVRPHLYHALEKFFSENML